MKSQKTLTAEWQPVGQQRPGCRHRRTRGKPLMRCPKCGKPLVCAACAGSVGGAARVAKGFASAEVQAKAQATRKRKARAARNSHNPSRQAPAAQEAP